MYLSLLHVNVNNRPGRQWLGNLYRIHQRLWMAFPDDQRRKEDPFFLGTWNGPTLAEPKPKRHEVGFLFRVERDGNPRILVQSVQRPDWQYAFQNAPYLLIDEPRVREFDPTLRHGQTYRFRLLANVVESKRVADPSGKTRKSQAGVAFPKTRRVEFLVHPDPIPDSLPEDFTERQTMLRARWNPWRKWLDEITAKRGFRVVDDEGSPLLMESVHTRVRNRKGPDGKNQIDWRFNAGLFEGNLVCADSDRLRDAIVTGIGPAKAFGFGLLSIAPAPIR